MGRSAEQVFAPGRLACAADAGLGCQDRGDESRQAISESALLPLVLAVLLAPAEIIAEDRTLWPTWPTTPDGEQVDIVYCQAVDNVYAGGGFSSRAAD